MFYSSIIFTYIELITCFIQITKYYSGPEYIYVYIYIFFFVCGPVLAFHVRTCRACTYIRCVLEIEFSNRETIYVKRRLYTLSYFKPPSKHGIKLSQPIFGRNRSAVLDAVSLFSMVPHKIYTYTIWNMTMYTIFFSRKSFRN